jgi:hypothetical protein
VHLDVSHFPAYLSFCDVHLDETSFVVQHILEMKLEMEAARISEMLVNFYQTTWCYNPEDSHLCTHHRENLKSYLDFIKIKRS